MERDYRILEELPLQALEDIAKYEYAIPDELEQRIGTLAKAKVGAQTRKIRPWVILAAAALAVLLGCGTLGVSSASWNAWLNADRADSLAEPVQISDTYEGLTVTLDSIIQDTDMTYLLVTLTDDRHEGRINADTAFAHISMMLDGVSSGATIDNLFYDETAQTLSLVIQETAAAPSSHGSIEMYNLTEMRPPKPGEGTILPDGTTEFTPDRIEGRWSLSFETPETIDAKAATEPVVLENGVVLNRISITPISLTLAYADCFSLDDIQSIFGSGTEVTLRYADGSEKVITAQPSGSQGMFNDIPASVDYGTGWTSGIAVIDDFDDVIAISYQGIEIPLEDV